MDIIDGLKKIVALEEIVIDAEQKIFTIQHELFPVGGEIRWERSGHSQIGTVEMWGSGNRIKVQNNSTGKSYWIHFFHVQVEFGMASLVWRGISDNGNDKYRNISISCVLPVGVNDWNVDW